MYSSVYSTLKSISQTDCTILLSGETGTGKTHLAEEIHRNSPRRNKRFVAINLATLNENLMESELFGHERGAFSGASHRRMGKLEFAQGGTVLLDEIGELPLTMQARLLEILSSKTACPVGSNHSINLDIRFIVATNRKLPEMVRLKEFREDLFYRINIFEYKLVSLVEKKEEIPELMKKFIGERTTEPITLMDCFLSKINAHSWPGNIRELKNVLEYSLAVRKENTLFASDLPAYFMESTEPDRNSVSLDTSCLPTDFYTAKASFEKLYIKAMLKQFNGKINQTAREIQLSKVTLLCKIRKYDINPEFYRGHQVPQTTSKRG